MTQVVTFDYATWVGQYPEFAACSAAQGQGWFDRAGFICANDTTNPANATPGFLSALLYLLTSHLAWLNAPRDASDNPSSSGQPPSPFVGRVSSAAEGSVNVSTEWNGSSSPSEAYFIQSRYGAEYWQMTAAFRTFRYAAQPTEVAGPIYPYRGRIV